MTKKKIENESIRGWYQRTTSTARKSLLFGTISMMLVASIVWTFVPASFIAQAQQFNGALTIPVAGLIWILGFLYIFLIPQREVGFRTQEFVESMSEAVKDTIEKEIVPAVVIWKRIGERIEQELPTFLKKVDEGIAEIRDASKKLAVAIEKNEGLAADAKPAIEALRRIEAKVEEEIKNGFFENARAAMDSVKSFTGGVQTREEAQEDLSYALKSIRKNKAAGRPS